MQAAGEPLSRVLDVASTLDPSRFRDSSTVDRLLGPLGPLAGLILEDGLYEGEYLRQWVRGVLADLGVRTFGDLRLPEDPGSSLRAGAPLPARRHRVGPLPAAARPASRGTTPRTAGRPRRAVRRRRRPGQRGDPAVLRALPAGLVHPGRRGLLSNFPVAIFDRTDGAEPRWPTFGVRLSGEPTAPPPGGLVRGPLGVVAATVGALLAGADSRYISDACVVSRTIFADAGSVSPVDFDLTLPQRRSLVRSGQQAAATFLQRWDFEAWTSSCR